MHVLIFAETYFWDNCPRPIHSSSLDDPSLSHELRYEDSLILVRNMSKMTANKIFEIEGQLTLDVPLKEKGRRYTEVGRARSTLNLAKHTARSSKFEVWSCGNFHFGWEIICKRLISLLVHLSRCPVSILSQFLSKMIVCETSNFTAKLRTSNFVLRAVCFARLRVERAWPTSVCPRPWWTNGGKWRKIWKRVKKCVEP